MNDFPSSINPPNRKVSGFTGSLWDDMDSRPFNYKTHYERYLNDWYKREKIDPSSFYRHRKLWPTAYEDVYKEPRKIGNFYFDKQTDEILSNGIFPTPVEGTLKTNQRERIARTIKKSSWGNEFIDQLKKGGWERKFRNWETYAGGAIGSFVANRSWKWLTGLGTVGTASLAVGMYSARKSNPNNDRANK